MLKFNLLHTFPAFTIKNYRTFFLSQWVALMGLWMQLTAQQWLVYEITDSPSAVRCSEYYAIYAKPPFHTVDRFLD